MTTTTNGRDDRSRALRRLRHLTIGTAVIGVVATGGLSVLAAATDARRHDRHDRDRPPPPTARRRATATDHDIDRHPDHRHAPDRGRLERHRPRVDRGLLSMETADWQALGTGVRLVVHGGDLAAARSAVERVLDDVDRACSRFRDDSELMRLRARRGAPGPVSPLLARAIAGALEAARASDGALDPTVGRAMRVIGYDADWDVVARRPGRGLELRVAPVPGWRRVELEPATGLLRLPPGSSSTSARPARGSRRTSPRRRRWTRSRGRPAGVLVSLGGDLATAGDPPAGGWRVTLAEDHRVDPAAPGRMPARPRSSRSPAARSPPPARPSVAGAAPTAPRATTSSTPGRACPRPPRGGR